MNANKNTPSVARTRFAHNVRISRLEQHISQEEFADRCGLHRTYVGSVERGERNISIDNMQAIADALGKKLTELLIE